MDPKPPSAQNRAPGLVLSCRQREVCVHLQYVSPGFCVRHDCIFISRFVSCFPPPRSFRAEAPSFLLNQTQSDADQALRRAAMDE